MDGAVDSLAQRARAGTLARLGIMGGTFDPPHLGHLACAEEALEAANLDAVLFVPTGRPAFKQDRLVTAGEVRLAMVAAAVAGNPAFAVSALEVERPGITYAVDTLRELREELPGVELVFIVGADAALTLPRWRRERRTGPPRDVRGRHAPRLRAGGGGSARLRERRFDVRPFVVPGIDISSSELRQRVAEGRTIRYLVPEAVREIIEEERCTERKPTMADWRSEEFYKERRDELEKRVGPRRFKHSLGVSETAETLACVYGADKTAARVAGLLHDWDKGYDDPGILARADELGMELDAELSAMPRVLHGLTAAVALGRAFPELPPEVLAAVERHTLGAVDMSDLDMIVYIADALEPGRKGKMVQKLREKVGELELRDLFLEVYAYWVQLIMERRHPMYSKTTEIWNSYMPEQEVYRAEANPDPVPYGRP